MKMVGVHGSELSAGAIDRTKTRPGSAEEPDSFTIDRYTIDEDNWTDGVVTVAVDGD